MDLDLNLTSLPLPFKTTSQFNSSHRQYLSPQANYVGAIQPTAFSQARSLPIDPDTRTPNELVYQVSRDRV